MRDMGKKGCKCGLLFLLWLVYMAAVRKKQQVGIIQ